MKVLKTKQFNPENVLAIYGNLDGEAYIEKHNVDSNGNVLSGRPLNVRELRKLGEALAKQTKKEGIHFAGLVPKNVVIYKSDDVGLTLGWVVKAGKSPMFFTKDLNIPDGVANHPDMLFLISDTDNLNVFWLKEPDVSIDTTLYVAPYHNVADNGSVCLGTVVRKFTGSVEELMNLYETAFFNSKFSHANATICSVIKFNLNDYWRERVNTDKSFSDSDFIESNVTIDSLIDE
ncbi:MAG: hypothetical protein ABJH04_07875 [Cyclobacteriaceae bacterium]